MAQRESTHRLKGAVQLDDAYLGGERIGGTPGRGSENKVPFMAAVSLSEESHPLRQARRCQRLLQPRDRQLGQGGPGATACRHQRRPCLLRCGHRRRLPAPARRRRPAQAARPAASSTGSTPSSATSRPRWPAPSTPSTTASTRLLSRELRLPVQSPVRPARIGRTSRRRRGAGRAAGRAGYSVGGTWLLIRTFVRRASVALAFAWFAGLHC